MSTTPAGATGLTAAEVAQRVARGQVNRVRRSNVAAYLDILARNVLTLYNAVIVPAAAALFALDKYQGAVAVSGMAVTNLILGLVQEFRAKRHLDRLTLLAEGQACVRRDGKVVAIASGDVVCDDVVVLSAGDVVPADGVVLEANFLEVDEALLTGESDPVPRNRGDRLLSGSFCVAGDGAYRADKVGIESFAQRTAAEAQTYRYSASPLQQNIDRLLRILSGVAVGLCGLYVALYQLRGITPDVLAEMVAATITSMIPQGLVLMATLAFILGAVRMADRGAVVQRLSAVESMASIDTLCMDKTGTLTTNRLKLERLHVLPGTGAIETDVRDLLRMFASASVDRNSKTVEALRVALGEATSEVLDQLPFKSQNRYSAVRLRCAGAEHVLVLGATEALQPLIPDAESRRETDATWAAVLSTGLRLLLFAQADGPRRATFGGSLDGFTLAPLALVGLSDEVRPEALEVLESLAAQGISFRILSGDNAETVRATVEPLARTSPCPALRALAESTVVTGGELAASANAADLVRQRCVFGRVSPWQKVEIVSTLKSLGRRVAMVGDGVNDVLPIKTADLGVAMGEGSSASKTVAGLVLETNDFCLLPQTLDEGRTILRNLRRAAKLFLVKNVYMVILWVASLTALGLPLPVILPQQVTLLNSLTIGIPALCIMFGIGGGAASRRSFLREIGDFVLRTGAVIGLAGLAVMLLNRHVWRDSGETLQRTCLLTTLILLGLDTLLRALADGGTAATLDRRLRWVPAGALPIYLAAMYVPAAASFFELAPLTPAQWLQLLVVVAPAAALARLSDRARAPEPAAAPSPSRF
jgi:magnesium-transporting ATPase (P-type)